MVQQEHRSVISHLLADRVNGSDDPTGCVCVCDGGVLWLNSYAGRVGFWSESYRSEQLLRIRWGLNPSTERQTSLEVDVGLRKFVECLFPY